MNLLDRFRECRAMNLPGIPRDELLGYLRQAAELLDALYEQEHFQHLDVRPENLVLDGEEVVLAGFDTVDCPTSERLRFADEVVGSLANGATPLYMAPEVCEGSVGRYCDQFSLAIVYQEMLTGARPFRGRNVAELFHERILGTPNLSALPEHDGLIIARALARRPSERFPSCSDLVRALKQSSPLSPASGERGRG